MEDKLRQLLELLARGKPGLGAILKLVKEWIHILEGVIRVSWSRCILPILARDIWRISLRIVTVAKRVVDHGQQSPVESDFSTLPVSRSQQAIGST